MDLTPTPICFVQQIDLFSTTKQLQLAIYHQQVEQLQPTVYLPSREQLQEKQLQRDLFWEYSSLKTK